MYASYIRDGQSKNVQVDITVDFSLVSSDTCNVQKDDELSERRNQLNRKKL